MENDRVAGDENYRRSKKTKGEVDLMGREIDDDD